MNIFPKINFVIENQKESLFYNTLSSDSDLKKRIMTALYFYNQDAFNFDFQAVILTELRYLLSAFVKHTIVIEINKQKIKPLEEAIASLKKCTSEMLMSLLYIQTLSAYVKENFYHEDDPNECAMNILFNLADETLHYGNIIVHALHSFLAIKQEIEDNLNDEYKFVLERFVTLFHDADVIIENCFKIHMSLTSNYSIVCFICNQFEYDYKNNGKQVVEYLYRKDIQDYFSKNNMEWEIRIVDFGFNPRKICLQSMNSVESITLTLIQHKVDIMDTLIKEISHSQISKELFDNCYHYFARFYELFLLRKELIVDANVYFDRLYVKFRFPEVKFYEESIIPRVFTEMLAFVITKKRQMRSYNSVCNSVRCKEIIKSLSKIKNINHEQHLHDANCFEIFDAIKYFISKHMNEFFTKYFRAKVTRLASRALTMPIQEYLNFRRRKSSTSLDNDNMQIMSITTPIEDCMKLKKYFNNMEMQSQSKVLYIFEFILR